MNVSDYYIPLTYIFIFLTVLIFPYVEMLLNPVRNHSCYSPIIHPYYREKIDPKTLQLQSSSQPAPF